MKTIKLKDLHDAVRAFFEQVPPTGGIRVEDDAGVARYSVVPYERATEEERQEALARLAEIQRTTREQMEREDKTEEQLDAILQEDE